MVNKEEAKQEPVAWGIVASNTGRICQVELDAEEVAEHNPKYVVPLYTHPSPVNAQEVRLWDSQWVNVVNHDNAYRDWSKEDAINHAVKMTEKLIAENVNGNKLPPTPVNQQLLEALKQAKDAIAEWGSYASEYFQKKHDLQGDLDAVQEAITKARAAIAQAEGKEVRHDDR